MAIGAIARGATKVATAAKRGRKKIRGRRSAAVKELMDNNPNLTRKEAEKIAA